MESFGRRGLFRLGDLHGLLRSNLAKMEQHEEPVGGHTYSHSHHVLTYCIRAHYYHFQSGAFSNRLERLGLLR